MSNGRTEADAVREIVQAGYGEAQVLELEGRQLVVLRNDGPDGGQRLQEIDQEEYRPPLRIEARPTFRDTKSFAAYVNHFKSDGTLLFGMLDNATIEARLAYHKPEEPSADEHVARLVFKHSPEWQAWTARHRKPIGQVEFAEFLEDRILDIAEPAGAEVKEACANLVAKKDVAFRSSIRLRDGAASLEYSEEVQQQQRQGTLRVPEMLTLSLRPYTHSERLLVTARLRFRITEGHLSFIVVLNQIEETLETAFRTETSLVEKAVGEEVLWGSAS